MTMARPAAPGTAAPPRLTITVEGAGVVEHAAVPTLSFTTRVGAAGATIRSVALTAQIRVATTRRHYDAGSQERLAELFGAPADWSRNLRSLLWTHAACQVPAFTGGTVVNIHVGCTYDFDVAVVKYFHALRDGDVPLEFLFSGTIFYTDGGALRVAQIPWDTESTFRMPVQTWKDAMDHYFPGSAWLRLDRDALDRLSAFKARNALPTWEAVVDALLPGGDGSRGGRPWTP